MNGYRLAASTLLLLVAACSAQAGSSDSAGTAVASPILGGSPATDHPEAVLLTWAVPRGTEFCSGSLIAPQVVLTAGHCVDGTSGWTALAPYAGGQSSTSTGGTVLDYRNDTGGVNGQQHDVALVFLTKPIVIPSYPTLARTPRADGALVQNIGRVNNGALSWTDLFAGPAVPSRDGASIGYPFDYVSTNIVQGGDSGGPVEIPGTNTIVAVNSGVGSDFQIMARVDPVYPWLQQQIAAHGGNGPQQGTSGSGSGSGGGTAAGASGSPVRYGASPGMCLDVAGASTANGTAVQLWPCNGTDAQKWTYTGGTLRALGKCLDLPLGNATGGTQLQLWDCVPNDAFQQWAISGGTLVYAGSNQCLDLRNGDTTAGSRLDISGCLTGIANQQWSF